MPDLSTPGHQGPVVAASDPDRSGQPRQLVRSEEQLAVTTVRVPTRRMRLKKYVVTETRTVTVQVSHEEVRLVEVDPARPSTDGDHLESDSDSNRWLIVSEERPVVTTQVVPIERVRLAVFSVTEDQDVTGDVRRERIALEPADGPPGRHRTSDTLDTSTLKD